MDSLLEAESRLNAAVEQRAKANIERALIKESVRQRAERMKRENLAAQCDNHLHLLGVYEERVQYHREQHETKSKRLRAMEWSVNGTPR